MPRATRRQTGNISRVTFTANGRVSPANDPDDAANALERGYGDHAEDGAGVSGHGTSENAGNVPNLPRAGGALVRSPAAAPDAAVVSVPVASMAPTAQRRARDADEGDSSDFVISFPGQDSAEETADAAIADEKVDVADMEQSADPDLQLDADADVESVVAPAGAYPEYFDVHAEVEYQSEQLDAPGAGAPGAVPADVVEHYDPASGVSFDSLAWGDEETKVLESHWHDAEPVGEDVPSRRFASRPRTVRLACPEDIRGTTTEPLWWWNKFFTSEMLEMVKVQTNFYAADRIGNRPPTDRPYIVRNWSEVTADEVKHWLGITICMGLHKRGSVNEYWEHCKVAGPAQFVRLMSRDRYLAIKRCLHLVRNPSVSDAMRAEDPLWKISPFLKLFAECCRAGMVPATEVSLDEMMVKFCGRTRFRCQMKNKPIKIGIKIYALCDAKTGYLLAFIINDKSEGKAIIMTHCMKLIDAAGLPSDAHVVYTDNLYTSVKLFKAFARRGLQACGTARGKAGVPQKLMATKAREVEHGAWKAMELPPGVFAYVWKDTSEHSMVKFLSTAHQPEKSHVRRWVRRAKSYQSVSAPSAAKDYNMHMGGVDLSDQLRQYSTTHQRSVKWWHALFFWVLDQSLVNAYVCYKESGGRLSQRDFRKSVAVQLLPRAPAGSPPAKKFRVEAGMPHPERAFHPPPFTLKHIGYNDQGKELRRACKYCRLAYGRERRSAFMCATCDAPLCRPTAKRDCVTGWHTAA